MALESYALDTLAGVKSFLGVDDDERDTDLEQLINQVSRAILRELDGREITPRAPSATIAVTREGDDSPATNEQHTLTITAGATGTFTLTYTEGTTAAISASANAAAVDAAIEAVLGAGTVTVTAVTGGFLIEYTGSLAATNVALPTVTDTALLLARTVEYVGGRKLVDLYPYEARSVTAVTIDPGGDNETVLTSDDWRLESAGSIVSRDGVYQRLRLKSEYGTGSWPSVPVLVTGTWGWEEVPSDVIGWLHELVEDRWKEDVAAYADADASLEEGAGAASFPVTIPFRIRDEMESYRLTVLGAV